MDDLKLKLEAIRENNLLRKMNYLESPQDKTIIIEGKEILLMSSNNYLGLANREELKEAAIEGIEKYGVGSGGSRLTTGSYEPHEKLEQSLFKFFNKEDAIIFNTGYGANLAVLQSICDETYTIISDEENHASIIDGCRLAKASKLIFKHNDMKDLEEKLNNVQTKNILIVTEDRKSVV